MAETTKHLIEISEKYKADPTARAKLKEIETALAGVGKVAPSATRKVNDFTQAIRRVAIVVPVWAALRPIFTGIVDAMYGLPRAAIEWEKQMAQIRRVGQGTNEEYQILSGRLLELARNFGISNKEVGSAAALWVQQGRALHEVAPLMEATAKLSLITGDTLANSVESLTSIIKSYKIESEDATSVIDKLTIVEQNHAITTQVLVDAMKKVAPMASNYGVSFEKLLGIITATHVATRATGQEIGNAWKTIFSRMSTSAIGAIQNIAKVPVYIDKTGKAVFTNTGTFRDWGQVLDEVMISMGTLNEVQQTQLANALAQKRQINFLLAAYNSWDEGIISTIESLEAFGTANKAVNILLGTTDSKIKQLQSAWNELGVAIIDNGQFIKDSIDFFKNLTVGVGEAITILKGFYGTELVAAGIEKKYLDDSTKKRKEQLSQLEALEKLQSMLAEAKAFELRIEEQPNLTDEQKKNILSVIQKRKEFIEETIDKIPKPDMSKLWLEADIIRTAKVSKISDQITALVVKIQKDIPQIGMGELKFASISDLQQRIKELQGIGKIEIFPGMAEQTKTSIKYLEELIKLKQERGKAASDEELKNIYDKTQAEKEFNELLKEEPEATESLTDEQQEQIDNERELLRFSLERDRTEEEILRKRKELVQNSEFLYDGQKKILELEKLSNQQLDLKIKRREEEQSRLGSLLEQYQKAGMLEKADIKRTIELQSMSPQQIADLYRAGGYDKAVIEDNLSSFTSEARELVHGVMAENLGVIEAINAFRDQQLPSMAQLGDLNVLSGAEIKITISGQETSAEELVGQIQQKIGDYLLEDEKFQSAFAQKKTIYERI